MPSTGQQPSLQQSHAQQQILSAQMRRSLEILQANTTDLAHLLTQAAAANPTLEISEDNPDIESLPVQDKENEETVITEDQDSWRENQIVTHAGHNHNQEDEERRQFLYNSIVAPLTLQQHLINQLNRSALSNEEHLVADYLIGCINERGFLDDALEKIAIQSPFSLSQLEKAQEHIKEFDPQGIGVENLQQSLLLQLKLLGKQDSLESRIVHSFLDKLAKRKINEISKALGVSTDAVIEAGEHIAQLNSNPGAAFDATSNPHVLPDLEIRTDEEGKFYAHLTGDNLPKIRISDYYKDLLGKLKIDPKARKFLQENIHEARQILDAVSQRQETLLKIGAEIVKRQPTFLHKGWSHLRPLTMQEIAESMDLHPATISRAVSGKFILTPHGLAELRRFFSSGYLTSSGEEISNTGVKEVIQKLIANENSNKPLSDEALKKRLTEKGIKVARRTIAKYREQLGILPSNLRKRHQ